MSEHLKIITEKENKILGFKEIEASLPFEKTPTKAEITKMIAEKYKAEEERLSIHHIKGSFGKNHFLIKARIYHNKEGKHHIETKKKKPKKAPGATGGKK